MWEIPALARVRIYSYCTIQSSALIHSCDEAYFGNFVSTVHLLNDLYWALMVMRNGVCAAVEVVWGFGTCILSDELLGGGEILCYMREKSSKGRGETLSFSRLD
jgi:hypothetical protein